MKFISTYWQKSKVSIEKGIINDTLGTPLQTAADTSLTDSKWFKLFFELCKNVNTPPRKDDFEKALQLVDKSTSSNRQRASIIQENYQKFYLKA